MLAESLKTFWHASNQVSEIITLPPTWIAHLNGVNIKSQNYFATDLIGM